jgi:hypothetical protein
MSLERGRLEKRAIARVLCNRIARIRAQGEEAPEEFATLSDLSATGAGLHLGRPFPTDTVLIVEPLSPGAQALLARVVHVKEDRRGWLHGCELSTRLSAEELRGWLGEVMEETCPTAR